MTRVLYWDIDGTIIDQSIDEAVKPALAGGAFQSWIEAAGFDHTICVSGRATMARDALFRPYEIAAGMSPEQEELGKRILMCDPEGDGSDIVAWLRSIAGHPRNGDGTG